MTSSFIKIIIPARSGSKGVISKNIRSFNDKSLLELAVDYCSKLNFNVIITTDSPDYIKRVKLFNSFKKNSEKFKFHNRSSWASSDEATDYDVLKDVLSAKLVSNDDIIAWVRPTTPLRCVLEFNLAIEKISTINNEWSTLRSVKKPKTHPYWMKTVVNEQMLSKPFISHKDEELYPNRQALPICYEISSEFDFIKVKNALLQKVFFPRPVYLFETHRMPKVDIDTEIDFKVAEIIYKNLEIIKC